MNDINILNNESNSRITEYFQQNEIQLIRAQEKKYPYVVVVYMPSVFRQMPVVFVPNDKCAPSATSINIVEPVPYVSGKLSDKTRKAVIGVTAYMVQQYKKRACVVFSESDCIYCELDGSNDPCNEPPSGGVNYDSLPK